MSLAPNYSSNIGTSAFLQAAGKLTRSQYGMDLRTNRYKVNRAYSQQWAENQIGQSDPQFFGLECVDYDITAGEVMDIVDLHYKGLLGVDDLKPPFPVNEFNLQSSTVNDNGSDGTTQTAVSFQYYTAQTTWKYCTLTFPTTPVYASIMGEAIIISPFNTNPPTPLTDLLYQTLAEVIHFHSEPAGRYWEVENTSAIILIATSLPPLGLREKITKDIKARFSKGKTKIKFVK